MKRYAAVLLALAAVFLFVFQSFGVYYSPNINDTYNYDWEGNGWVTEDGSQISYNGTNGVKGTYYLQTSSNREIKATLRSTYPDGPYYGYPKFGAMFNATSTGSGGLFVNVTCGGNLEVRSASNWNYTTLASTTVSCGDGSVVRVVMRDTTWPAIDILVYVDNVLKLRYQGTDPNGTSGSYLGFSGGNVIWSAGMVTTLGLGNLLTSPPSAPTGFSYSAYSNHVDFSWNSTGGDTYNYTIRRNGVEIGSTTSTSFSDTTVVPNSTYQYSVSAVDFHGNVGTAGTFSATTPKIETTGQFPSATPEGRRVGVRSTGAYWGAGGENIDVLSGNLNFSLPILGAQSRGGGIGFGLSYNSQLWRNDTGGNWAYGRDVGYGYGWRLMAGALVPRFSNPTTISHYLFIDSSGAEYRFTDQKNGIWQSNQSAYLYFDPATTRLYFPNGSFWEFGCVSASTEPDQGVMYPTLMEDSNGNQVKVRYETASGAAWTNSSARIKQIEDIRAVNQSGVYNTYTFTYSSGRLASIDNTISSGERLTFTYLTGQSLTSPWGGSFGTVAYLQKVAMTDSPYLSHEFTYNSSAEMTQVQLPYRGKLSYEYTTATYSNGTSTKFREVQNRKLWKDGSTNTNYAFSHETSPGPNVHSWTQLNDPGGLGQKYWEFNTTGTYMGLVSKYEGREQSGPVKVRDQFTWSQDTESDPDLKNSYISAVLTTADPGQSYSIQKKTEQTIDLYGNVTQVKIYDWGNITTALKTTNFTYLGTSPYTSRFIFNRVTSTPTSTISYDQTSLANVSNPRNWDNYYQSITVRGNPTTITALGTTQTVKYNVLGEAYETAVNGVTSNATFVNTNNFGAPTALSVTGTTAYDQSMSYDTALRMTSQTNAGGYNAVSFSSNGRPATTTNSYGVVSAMTYYDGAYPHTQTATANNRWTKSTLDGLGRPTKAESGYSSTTVSVAETEYDSCGCSPTGKVKKTSLPYAPGTSSNDKVWTTYTYDGIGRTLQAETKKAASPETQTKTTYVYEGNTVKVTDAATKWKKYTLDVFGQIKQVNEPNPAGGEYVTNYTYSLTTGALLTVSMPRPTGTQTRTFTYSGTLLTSTVLPENGTTNYYYNSDKTLNYKVDAKGQRTVYTYDAYKRVTQKKQGTWGNLPHAIGLGGAGTPNYTVITSVGGLSFTTNAQGYMTETKYVEPQTLGNIEIYYVHNPPYSPQFSPGYLVVNGTGYEPFPLLEEGPFCDPDTHECAARYYTAGVQPVTGLQEDLCQRVDYTYDTNLSGSTFGSNLNGRLAAIQYKGGYNDSASPTCDIAFTEMYSYNSVGAVSKKRLRVKRGTLADVDLDAEYTRDSEGRLSRTKYPASWNSGTETWDAGPELENVYDSMSRLQKVKYYGGSDIISNATYNASGQLLTLSGSVSETRTYNSLGQITGISGGGYTRTYNYSPTQNNGKITSEVISGETVTYTYDALNRLASATNAGASPSWGESYGYDGFGNLTTKTVTQGTGNPLSVSYSASTNRRTGDCADANGNIGEAAACSNGMYYDMSNRVVRNEGTLAWAYSYDPGNKRVWRGNWSGGSQTVDEVTFYGANGQKLRTYALSTSAAIATATGTWEYFGGKLIKNAAGYVVPDIRGSHGKYYPWGEERPSATSNGKEKFATYHRDTETGLDYADQRYHDPGDGRFMTPDPYMASGGPDDPGSWNRYAYTRGDPVNRFDPPGLADFKVTGTGYYDRGSDSGGGNGGGVGTGFNDRFGNPGQDLGNQDNQSSEELAPDPYVVSSGIFDSLQKVVADRQLGDCQAMTGLATGISNALTASGFASDAGAFVRYLSELLIPESTLDKFFGGGIAAANFFGIGYRHGGTHDDLLNANDSGSAFKALFQDGQYESGDQAHHFAFFFQLGFLYGSELPTALAVFMDFGNEGDQILGGVAAHLGQLLAANQTAAGIASAISSMGELCDPLRANGVQP